MAIDRALISWCLIGFTDCTSSHAKYQRSDFECGVIMRGVLTIAVVGVVAASTAFGITPAAAEGGLSVTPIFWWARTAYVRQAKDASTTAYIYTDATKLPSQTNFPGLNLNYHMPDVWGGVSLSLTGLYAIGEPAKAIGTATDGAGRSFLADATSRLDSKDAEILLRWQVLGGRFNYFVGGRYIEDNLEWTVSYDGGKVYKQVEKTQTIAGEVGFGFTVAPSLISDWRLFGNVSLLYGPSQRFVGHGQADLKQQTGQQDPGGTFGYDINAGATYSWGSVDISTRYRMLSLQPDNQIFDERLTRGAEFNMTYRF